MIHVELFIMQNHGMRTSLAELHSLSFSSYKHHYHIDIEILLREDSLIG